MTVPARAHYSSTVLAPESVASHVAALRSVFATGKTEEYDYVRAPDGSSHWNRSQFFTLGDDAPPEGRDRGEHIMEL